MVVIFSCMFWSVVVRLDMCVVMYISGNKTGDASLVNLIIIARKPEEICKQPRLLCGSPRSSIITSFLALPVLVHGTITAP